MQLGDTMQQNAEKWPRDKKSLTIFLFGCYNRVGGNAGYRSALFNSLQSKTCDGLLPQHPERKV